MGKTGKTTRITFDHFYFLALFLCFSAPTAMAQNAQEEARQQSRQIIQQFEQERRQQKIEQDIERGRESLAPETRPAPTQPEPEGPCIQVDVIELGGMTLFHPSDLKHIKDAYAGRCLYISDIEALAKDITDYYIERGYITSRAYVPPQDLSNGSLKLQMVEGTLEKIEYAPERGNWPEREIDMAFPNSEGHPLNLRDIEQGLDQMNRLQSGNVRMELAPGEAGGASIVKVINDKTRPWQVKTLIDNSGSESTGEWQGTVGLDYDNLLDANDLVSLAFKHDLEGADRRQSRSFSGLFELPFGYWNFYYSLNYFDYVSEISAGIVDLKTTGLSRVHDIGLRRVIHRDQSSKTTISSSLVARENENFLSGLKLSASSQKLTYFNLGLSHARQLEKAFIYAALNYSSGTGWLGAQEDTALDPSEPRAEFDRFTADISATRLWDAGLGKYNPTSELALHGQWSADTLYGSEQISVGGPYSVRGFKSASLSGDTGYFARLIVSIPVILSDLDLTNRVIGIIRPYLGFDTGTVKSDGKNPLEGGTLRSWSLGMKNEGGMFDFGLCYSQPVSSPDFLDPRHQEVYFTLSIKF